MKFSRSMWKLGIASSLALTLLAVGGPAIAQTSGLTVEEAKVDTSPKYYGLHFDLSVYDGSGLNSVGQNYRNDLSFYIEPSWDIGRAFSKLRATRWKTLQLAARFVVSANLSGTDESSFSGNTNTGPQGTCSNITPASNGGVVNPGSVGYCNPASATRRADYSDVWLTLRAPSLYKWSNPDYTFSLSPAIRGVFPASMESRYATLIASVTPSIGMSHTFWKGRLRGSFSFGVTKNFHQQSTTRLQANNNGTVSTTGGNPYDGALSSGLSNFYADPSRVASFGGLNTNFALLSIISGGVNFSDKWSFDALYIVSNAYPYSQDCVQQVQGYSVDLCSTGTAVASASGSELWRPGRRDTQTFWASLNYQPWEWIGFSVSWINSAPMWKPDSTYRQAIISTDYNAFTTISFGTSISIDHFADMLEKRNKKKRVDPVAKSNAVSFQ